MIQNGVFVQTVSMFLILPRSTAPYFQTLGQKKEDETSNNDAIISPMVMHDV